MAFDIESLGGGAGAGLIAGIFGAIASVLGINRRVNRVENDKQDKSVCNVVHKSIDDKFNILIEGQGKLFDKVDRMNEYLRNGK